MFSRWSRGSNAPKTLSEDLQAQLQKGSKCLLFNRDIDDEKVAELAQTLQSGSSLTALNFGRNKIGDSGVKILLNIFRNSVSLSILHLHDNQIGDGGAATIAETLKSNVSLREIYLNGNRIGDMGATAIAAALAINASVHKVMLARNQICDTGALAISDSLKSNTALQSLDLRNNQLTETGLDSLTQISAANEAIQIWVVDDSPAAEAETAETDDTPKQDEVKLPAGEFMIFLDSHAKDLLLGITLQPDRANGSLKILSINDAGLIAKWNAQSPPESVVEVGDHIMQINRCRGNVNSMIHECKKSQARRVVMKRAAAFAATVSAGQSVLIVDFRDRPSLNGSKAEAVQWFENMKRWKVRLEDSTVLMCRAEELKVDTDPQSGSGAGSGTGAGSGSDNATGLQPLGSRGVPSGYRAGDKVFSKIECTLANGKKLHKGDEGTFRGLSPPPSDAEARSKTMVSVLFEVGQVEMSLANITRRLEYRIAIEKTPFTTLGLDVEYGDRGTLLVLTNIKPGIIDEYNRFGNPDLVVKSGDRIVEVNGRRGDARALADECKSNRLLNIVLQRY
eukprot:TRINITY_DN28496_c0_g1_i2.p1 TRINITY_DN28496_c0_g1~~TRINITY_DN28496_c0_g1_i2.p1  ORF type:complete len:572 (+),score=89.72 TRINITY_DN28496_c0_g1_i2:24-1718(+)